MEAVAASMEVSWLCQELGFDNLAKKGTARRASDPSLSRNEKD
jgi:hypothetical protein